MRRPWRVALAVIAAALMVLSQQSAALADDPLQDALRKKEELSRAVAISRQNAERYRQAAGQYEAAVGAANARIADLAARQASAQTQADALGFEIQIAEEQLQLVGFQLTETRSLVDSLKTQAAARTRQLAAQEATYAKHLRVTYRQVQVSPLEMLLSSGSLAEFITRIQAMIFIDRQDARLAQAIRALRSTTADQQAVMSLKEVEIAGLQDQISKQRADLTSKKAQYDELVRQAQSAIGQQSALRAEAGQSAAQQRQNQQQATNESAQLNKQLEAAEANYVWLAAQQAAKSGLLPFTGRMNVWPLRGPVTSPFGARWGGFHNGMDIAAPKYTPVVAGAQGIVQTVGRPYIASGDTAVVVIIAHGSNLATLYGHLDDSRWPPVTVGQRVNAGQVIGYVGMTGWTTGPHLHFMAIVNGRATDPAPYLP